MNPIHDSVFPKEILEFLSCHSGGIYLDCTLGDGGHSELILKESSPLGQLIGIDRDPEGVLRASQRLEAFEGRFRLFVENYSNINAVMASAGVSRFDGIIIDAGISSYQLSEADRGFSFMHDSPLDMRMSQEDSLTAYDVVNGFTEKKLSEIFFEYGEEYQARKIARVICDVRKKEKIKTTKQLGDLVHRCKKKKNTAVRSETKVFQAIRIAVNNELESLKAGVKSAIGALAPNGKLCVIAFHSLEDRIVKLAFRDTYRADKKQFSLLTPKPLVPSREEVYGNPRSRSAKLRCIQKNNIEAV